MKLPSDKKTLNQIFILSIIIALIVLLAYYQFLLSPAFHNLAKYYKHINQYSKDISEIKRDVKNIEILKVNLQNKEILSERLKNALLNKLELPSFLEEISNIAQDTNMDLVSIKPLKEEAANLKEHINRMPIELELIGSYHDFGRFINKLETNAKFIKLSDLKINSMLESLEKHNFYIVINIYTTE